MNGRSEGVESGRDLDPHAYRRIDFARANAATLARQIRSLFLDVPDGSHVGGPIQAALTNVEEATRLLEEACREDPLKRDKKSR